VPTRGSVEVSAFSSIGSSDWLITRPSSRTLRSNSVWLSS
jgi:hypothetical protein